MENKKGCSCPHCETELKKGCMEPGFCKPCGVKKFKVCPECKAQYLPEYDECPSCAVSKQTKK